MSLLFVLLCTSGLSLFYAIHEKSEANGLENSRNQLTASLSDARTEIQKLSSRLDAMAVSTANTPQPPPVQPPPKPAPVVRSRSVAQPPVRNTDDWRWRRVESQLTNHQSQIADQRERLAKTQEDIRKTSDHLDGRITSTREELNRSITTAHDDVLLLKKRGERNFYEFDLSKSKQFQRVGPLSLSLRKADVKHQSYDLSLMVEDRPVEKQRVNLSEPVWITLSDSSQPLQLVVNQIDKNRVRGYVSVPRYRNADLAGMGGPNATPASTLKSR
jgi:hypothetical protein